LGLDLGISFFGLGVLRQMAEEHDSHPSFPFL
jgi:hypothetical protein